MPGRRIGVESGLDSAATTSTAPSSASETARLRRNQSRSTRAGARFQSSRVARVFLSPWTRTRSFTLTPVSSALGGSTLSPWDTHEPVTLPPGPSTPGLLQTLGMLTRPHGFMERCRRRYGDVFTIDVAPYGRMVFIAEPELIRQVFTGDTSLYHVGGVRGRILGPMLGKHSLLILDEQEHMRERKLMLPAFHGEALRRYPAMIEELADEQVRAWPVGEEVAPRRLMQAITLEVILRVVFGVREAEAREELSDLLGRLLDHSTELLFLVTALERDIRWFPPWRRFVENREAADALIYREIAAARILTVTTCCRYSCRARPTVGTRSATRSCATS